VWQRQMVFQRQMPDLEKLRRALFQEALRLQVRREHSRHELTQKLMLKLGQAQVANSELNNAEPEFQAALVASIIDELGAKHFQSDQRFAQQRAAHRGARYGNQRIKQELSQRGVDGQTIAEVLDEGESELFRCRNVWLKKFGGPAVGREEIARQVRFLQYRGFSGATIRQVMNSSPDEWTDGLVFEET
jgi:regulatory protein